jgi:UDP-N-acetylglucosamine 2-epimerase (non-hydrolysing)
MFARGNRQRVLLVAGTRPECLKLASVVRALRERADVDATLMNSGQHIEMVTRSFAQLDLAADVVGAQCRAHSLSATLRALRAGIREAAGRDQATLLVSQGDTSTAYATALAARDLALPLAHVEAGLRTDHPLRPFPEEYFRRAIGKLAQLHFAPTALAERNLLAEGVDAASIHRVGNTAIDVLCEVVQTSATTILPPLPSTRRVIALTLHRRENYGRGLDTVCEAVLRLLDAEPDVGVVCPVHPNPTVSARIRRHLSNHPRIVLTEPLDYRPFIALLARATLAITDSGGIQEEAPYLGTPILVARENTERPETLALGFASLVPVHVDEIVRAARALLAAPRSQAIAFDAQAPYGDGCAGIRIAEILASFRTHARAADPIKSALFAA